MNIPDRVWDGVDIPDPVAAALISSPTFERLRDVDQSGYFEIRYPGTAHTRFEHSVGVYHILTRFGASLEERVSGLIHDVSHGVFSHCLDYALPTGSEKSQSYQDSVHDRYVKSTDIPDILRTHGLDPELVLEDARHPLKERNLPDLCADRIDYSLRSAVMFGELSRQNAQLMLDHLRIIRTAWVFDSMENAKSFAYLFKRLNDTYYSGFASAVMFSTVGKTLQYALCASHIAEADLYRTDTHVLSILEKKSRTDRTLRDLYMRMKHPQRIQNDPADYDDEVWVKSRVVDPLFLEGSHVVRLSERDPEWRTIVDKESKPRQYFLKTR